MPWMSEAHTRDLLANTHIQNYNHRHSLGLGRTHTKNGNICASLPWRGYKKISPFPNQRAVRHRARQEAQGTL